MSAHPRRVKAPEATRRKMLDAAFAEFYRNGFQGGSLNHIVAVAGTTKGALFHHFRGKLDLGYAVVDDVLGRLLRERWLQPLADSRDPLADLQRALRQLVATDIQTGDWLQGCPLNNLAQEMSPLDEGFRRRISEQYDCMRQAIAAALADGVAAGTIRRDVDPGKVAALVVAAQMGIWGTGKSSRTQGVMLRATDALCDYLESLRA